MQPVENTNEEQKKGAIAPVEAIRAEDTANTESGLVFALMAHRLQAGLPHESEMTVEDLVETFTTMGEAPFIRLFTEVAETSGNPTLVKQHLNDFIDKHRVQLDQEITDGQQAEMAVTDMVVDSVIPDQVQQPELPLPIVKTSPKKTVIQKPEQKAEAVSLPLVATSTSFEIVLKRDPLPLSAVQVTPTVEEPKKEEITFQTMDVVEAFPKEKIPVVTKVEKDLPEDLAVPTSSEVQMDIVVVEAPSDQAVMEERVPTILPRKKDEQPTQKIIISTTPEMTVAHNETVSVKTEKTVDVPPVTQVVETVAPVAIPVAEKPSVEIETTDSISSEIQVPDLPLPKKIMVKPVAVIPKAVIVPTVAIEKTIPAITTEIVETEAKSQPFVKEPEESTATTVMTTPRAEETTPNTHKVVTPKLFEAPSDFEVLSDEQKILDENPAIMVETVSETPVVGMAMKIDAPVVIPVATVKEMVVVSDTPPEKMIPPVALAAPLEDLAQTGTTIEEAPVFQSGMLTDDTRILKFQPEKTHQATDDIPARPVIRLQVSLEEETRKIRSNGQGMTTSAPEVQPEETVEQKPISHIKTRSYSAIFPKPVLTQFNQGAIETQRPQIVDTVQAQPEPDPASLAVNAYARMHQLPEYYDIAAEPTTPLSNPVIPFRRVYNMAG